MAGRVRLFLRRLSTVVAVGALTAVIAACAGSPERATTAAHGAGEEWDPDRSPTGSAVDADNTRARRLARLRREAPRFLGHVFACAVAPEPDSAPIRLFVTAPAARPRARTLLRRIGGASAATVHVAPPETQHALRANLVTRLRANAPPGVVAVDEEAGNRSGCPRVVIYLPKPPDEPSPEAKAWAQDMVTAFGTRRLVTGQRGRLGFLEPEAR